MDRPTCDDSQSARPRLRLSFAAPTAPRSVWIHGFSAENDNDAGKGLAPVRAPRGLVVVPRLPPNRRS